MDVKKLLIYGISSLVLLALLVFLILPKAGIDIPLAVSGFSTLSLSPNVQFNSNDPTIGGPAWLLTVSQNGAGQSAYGTFTASDSSTQATSNQFTITTSLDKDYTTYNIFNQGVPITSVEYTTTTYNPLGSESGCNSNVWQNYISYGIIPGISTVYCYNFVTDGYYGTIGPANINFQSTVSASGTGGSDSCVVNSILTNSCVSSGGNIQTSWVGSLVSGQAAPDPTSQGIIAVYNTAKGGWETANQNSYTSWVTTASNFNSCLKPTGLSLSSYNAAPCFQNYANAEQALMAGYSFTVSGGNSYIASGSQNSGQITLNLPTPTQFPVLTMRIKASLIGINIPVGMPKITSGSSQTFQTGQNGIITTTIQNVGTGNGNFNVGASCTDGFMQQGNALTISNLAPGNSQTVYIPITSNVASATASGTCTVTATDIGNPNNHDSKTVSVLSNAIFICTNGQVSTDGSNIEQCENNAWVVIQTCNSTQTATLGSNGATCVNNNGNGGNNQCGFLGLGCLFNNIGNWISSIFETIQIVVTLLVLIISFVISISFLGGMRFFEDKKWLAWIFSLVIASLLAFLVIKIFWAGVIVFILYLIIKSIFGGKLKKRLKI